MTSARLRVFAICTVLGFELADAMLVDEVPSAADLAEPGTTRIVGSVASILGTTPVAIEGAVVRVAIASRDAHRRLRSMLAPVHRTFRLEQRWGVFARIDREVERLRIVIGRGDTSRTLYVAGGEGNDEALERLCDHRRVSGVWHRSHGGVTDEYPRLAAVLARRVLSAHPDADYVELLIERYPVDRSRVADPSEVRIVYADRISRDELR